MKIRQYNSNIFNKTNLVLFWKKDGYQVIEKNSFILLFKNQNKIRYSGVVHFCEKVKNGSGYIYTENVLTSSILKNRTCQYCGREIPKNLIIIYKLKQLGTKL